MKTVMQIEIKEGTFGYTLSDGRKMFRATIKAGKACGPGKWTESKDDYEVSPAAEMSAIDALDAAWREVLGRTQ